MTREQTVAVGREDRRLSVAGQLRRIAGLSASGLRSLFVDAFSTWQARSAPRLGAALAYYALFSLAPLLLVIVAIVGLVFGPEAARGEIAPRLQELMGPRGANAVELLLLQTGTPGGGIVATVVGLVSIFFGATLGVNELRNVLNIIWNIEPESGGAGGLLGGVRSLLSDRLFAFLSVMALGGLLVGAAVASSVLAFVGSHFETWLPAPQLALAAVNVAVSWLMTTCLFTLVYLKLPDAAIARADAIVGAMMTAVLFSVGGLVISQILARTAPASAYGTAGSILALLLWLYYSALVFLFGAALTAVFAQRHGNGLTPRRHTLGRALPDRGDSP